jgi:hypothetical protein
MFLIPGAGADDSTGEMTFTACWQRGHIPALENATVRWWSEITISILLFFMVTKIGARLRLASIRDSFLSGRRLRHERLLILKTFRKHSERFGNIGI